MRRLCSIGGACVVSLLLFTTSAFGVLIDDLNGGLMSTRWYWGGSNDYFQTRYASSTPTPASISILNISTTMTHGTEYVMLGGTFAMTTSALLQDLTTQNGGLAKGVFASGATLTINGTLYNNDLTQTVATGDLIIAQIMYEWELEEQAAPPAPSNTVRGHAFFDITGGKLSDPGLNSASLQLKDFWLNFTFASSSPEVTDFLTTTRAYYGCSSPQIQFTPVPEPSSILLLGIAGLAALKRRKK